MGGFPLCLLHVVTEHGAELPLSTHFNPW